jgi:hypothetical protein
LPLSSDGTYVRVPWFSGSGDRVDDRVDPAAVGSAFPAQCLAEFDDPVSVARDRDDELDVEASETLLDLVERDPEELG